jgi:hypothetical protein
MMFSTMERLFMDGGHNIITRTPEEVPCFPFDAGSYMKEMVISLAPGVLFFEAEYRTNYHLLRYGFNIGPTSVGISLVGHFWMLGTWLGVVFGGVLTGLTHGLGMFLIRRARQVSWAKGLIFCAIIITTMFDTFGEDFIQLFRMVIWRWMLAALIWIVIRMFIPQSPEVAEREIQQSQGAIPAPA